PEQIYKTCRSSGFRPTFWRMTMTYSARLPAHGRTPVNKRKPKRSHKAPSQGAFGVALGVASWVALRYQRRATERGVEGLAVATPVLGGVRRHKTYPRSYRRVGGRYRQSPGQNNSCDGDRVVTEGAFQQGRRGDQGG